MKVIYIHAFHLVKHFCNCNDVQLHNMKCSATVSRKLRPQRQIRQAAIEQAFEQQELSRRPLEHWFNVLLVTQRNFEIGASLVNHARDVSC